MFTQAVLCWPCGVSHVPVMLTLPMSSPWLCSSLPHPACLPVGVERNYEKEQLERERLAPVSYELEKEKHILRQMQGRRLEELNPGEYHSTCNPQHPVMLEGHWQDPPFNELLKHDTVHQLQVGCGTLSDGLWYTLRCVVVHS